MRVFDGTSLVGGATLALLTGCSGSNIAGPTIGGEIPPAAIGTQTSSGTLASSRLLLTGTPTHSSGFIDLAAIAKNRGPTIAVSAGNVVDIFTPAFMQQVGLLTGFDNPRGVASDNKGDLYVADQENSRVQFYAAGFASPPTTLSDPGEYPLGVDVSANGKYVAVTNELATPLGPGSVSIFKESTLQRTITYSNLEYASIARLMGRGTSTSMARI
jgi:DNA-binding beta-propeller fold protein YncE